MQDLLRLLQMVQGQLPQQPQMGPQQPFTAPLHPSIMEQRNLLRGDPYAESIFQQAYGGQDNSPEEPQYEQSRHPGIEGVTGAVGDYLDQSNFRPRNFGEGLAAGFLKGGVGAFNEGARVREAGNAEKKAAYKAQQKSAYEQKLQAQKDYAGMAKDARKRSLQPASMTPEEKLKYEEDRAGAYVRGRAKAQTELGIPIKPTPRPVAAPKEKPKPKFVLTTPAEKAGISGAEKKEKAVLSALLQGPYKYRKAEAANDTTYVKVRDNLLRARKRATLSALKRASGDAEAMKQIELSIPPGDPLEDDPEIGAYFSGGR